ncbi:2-oxoacid:ferredoxin oxidoreductase subunit beta [Calorimonas adulescens]|jgi:2-oxoglutarate ferredoxin oxidoreductase, beta subunit (EC 1.2.7.3)|uniref:2-oxoacid:ferredoxin oxidoreductase subunit beta n=1 Tax=Calorimonas adulescens TaxID=2606906 RepID=A0A5D8QBB9_9THEO|nr:2-oxoacid:ferredoxin oxidoreductase subunit beta [Calorimonas adulescens]TZE80813.1 2-oxoacid:ferredoxin oxidoreductase subunit beta [Calorimonas adulescens]
MPSEFVKQYFRVDTLPHIWCEGCGNGILMNDIAHAIDNLRLNQDKVVIVSGIGCSSRATGYMNFDTLHTTHGRAIAFATGIKLANPELTVIVITGDGDCLAIGGNHFIHAARRNIDITVVLFNNSIYGMTGGQYSPTTPTGEYAMTAPYGMIERNFDSCKLAEAAGATYIARGTAFNTTQMIGLLERAIQHKGFSFVEGVSTCPTYYGRKNKKGDAVDMMDWQRKHAIDIKAASRMKSEFLADKFLTGEFKCIDEPEYTEEYQKIIDKLQLQEG